MDFSFKTLENCYLKTTYSIEVGDRLVEPGEVVAKFDEIQLAGLDEFVQTITANGGFDNRPHVFWETTKEIDLSFSKGVFSKEQFGIMANSKLFKIEKEQPIELTSSEILESNSEGIITLKEEPVSLFIYKSSTGEKISPKEINGKEIDVGAPYLDVLVYYTYNYLAGATMVKIGNKLFNGFLQLEATTKTKDDTTGEIKPAVLKIPKLRLKTGLSLRLGAQATPVVGNFKAVGVPTGTRGNSYVSEFYFLD